MTTKLLIRRENPEVVELTSTGDRAKKSRQVSDELEAQACYSAGAPGLIRVRYYGPFVFCCFSLSVLEYLFPGGDFRDIFKLNSNGAIYRDTQVIYTRIGASLLKIISGNRTR